MGRKERPYGGRGQVRYLPATCPSPHAPGHDAVQEHSAIPAVHQRRRLDVLLNGGHIEHGLEDVGEGESATADQPGEEDTDEAGGLKDSERDIVGQCKRERGAAGGRPAAVQRAEREVSIGSRVSS